LAAALSICTIDRQRNALPGPALAGLGVSGQRDLILFPYIFIRGAFKTEKSRPKAAFRHLLLRKQIKPLS
jgi:hypothetical protein